MNNFISLKDVDLLLKSGQKEQARATVSFMESSDIYPKGLRERLIGFGQTRWNASLDSKSILIVLHDLEVGGAQDLMLAFGAWLKARTQYSPVFIAMRTGTNFRMFTEVYPSLVLDCSPENELANKRLVAEFIGQHKPTLGLVNSVASGGICDYLPSDISFPWLAYIHELNQLLEIFKDNLVKLNSLCQAFIAGSMVVASVLEGNERVTLPIHTCEAFIDWRKVWKEPSPTALTRSAITSHCSPGRNAKPKTFRVVGCGTLHWRKDPLLFIQVAVDLLRNQELSWIDQLEFVWYGGGPDFAECREVVSKTEFADRIHFAGHCDDLQREFLQADLLLLCSVEDPFPLTAIQAGVLGVPIITIEGTGGIANLLQMHDLPIARSRSAHDLAKDVQGLINDEFYYADVSVRTKRLFTRNFTSLTHARQLFLLVIGVAGLKPLVSVVLPNYNCSAFLEKRLYTILLQTFQDFEVIILDDASTDNSMELLHELTQFSRYDKLIQNKINSGSVFHQWKLGIENAKGQYIWIAESDDFVDLDFLDLALSSILLNDASFAYCNSVPVDVNGEAYGDYRDLYLNQFAPGKWDSSYTRSGLDEITTSLGIANTVPNASSTIFDRKLLTQSDLHQAMEFKMCGDWFIYVILASRSRVSFVQNCNNYHTRHASSSSFSTEKTLVYFHELTRVYQTINTLFGYDLIRGYRQFSHLLKEYERFNIQINDYNIELSALFGQTTLKADYPPVAFLLSDLSPGGGQLIQIRLAEAYIKQGALAILMNLNMYESHPEVCKAIPAHIPLLNVHVYDPKELPGFLQKLGFKVIHSALWWADKFSYNCFVETPFILISSMHGCYETLVKNPEIDPAFLSLLPKIVSRFQGFIFTSEKHRAVLTGLGYAPANSAFIFNGYERQQIGIEAIQLKKEIGVPPLNKVLLIASRAVEGKGWDLAIHALKILLKEITNLSLVLIGDGELKSTMEVLSKQLGVHDSVRFIGHVHQLADYISIADVCLLPSTFVGESMPLILIEYMAQSKAIVTTNVGSIPLMLETENHSKAGIILDTKQLNANVLSDALLYILRRPEIIEKLQQRATSAFKKFDMKQCIKLHAEFYQRCSSPSLN
ncbi:MAG: glycosyltransferase [Cyanobacteriota bacterium]|nr:glycosyltransferase [Cyanobacteriota bacterium]